MGSAYKHDQELPISRAYKRDPELPISRAYKHDPELPISKVQICFYVSSCSTPTDPTVTRLSPDKI